MGFGYGVQSDVLQRPIVYPTIDCLLPYGDAVSSESDERGYSRSVELRHNGDEH